MCCASNYQDYLTDFDCKKTPILMHFISDLWKPQFKTEDGRDANVKYYQFVNGLPDCETTQRRPIYILGNPKSEDEYVQTNKLHYQNMS